MATKKNETVKVTLEAPIKRGDNEVTEITLRKPNSGELRGTQLAQLMVMDVDSIADVVERISKPMVSAADYVTMDPADMMSIALEVAGFLGGSQGGFQNR